ncbi:MAG: hypothetical protein IPJ58_19205 [Ardenticatenia bacterium]|nr:hypothetical protein [Ardenticatenia bacterium]
MERGTVCSDPNASQAHAAPCLPAVMFQAWIDALFERQLDNATLMVINQLKVLVQDRYFLFRRRLTAEHTLEDGKRPDHRCVYSVYESAIEVLHKHELILEPPSLARPGPKLKKPRTGISRILLGDIEPSESN